jgi:hypothetical protein
VQILEKAIEFGVEDDFSKEDLQKLEIAAILHDIAKADQVEEKFRHIPNYILVTHAERAAAEVPRIITDEFLRSNGFVGEPNRIREDIQIAILQHMGPHPGFMTETLSKVNEILRTMGEKEIIHPQAEGKISEALLAADMYSLATAEGRVKVLEIRSKVDKFRQEDEEMAKQCSAQGILVSAGEIALISGYESAQSALNMVENEQYREKIKRAIIASKFRVYDYRGKTVEFEEAFRKVYGCRTLSTLYH